MDFFAFSRWTIEVWDNQSTWIFGTQLARWEKTSWLGCSSLSHIYHVMSSWGAGTENHWTTFFFQEEYDTLRPLSYPGAVRFTVSLCKMFWFVFAWRDFLKSRIYSSSAFLSTRQTATKTWKPSGSQRCQCPTCFVAFFVLYWAHSSQILQSGQAPCSSLSCCAGRDQGEKNNNNVWGFLFMFTSCNTHFGSDSMKQVAPGGFEKRWGDDCCLESQRTGSDHPGAGRETEQRAEVSCPQSNLVKSNPRLFLKSILI